MKFPTLRYTIIFMACYALIVTIFMIADNEKWIAYDSDLSIIWWIGYIVTFPVRLLLGGFS